MDERLQHAMRRLGYRPMGQGVWGKPVAHHLLTIRMVEGVATFANYFLGVRGQMLVWNTHKIEDSADCEGYEASIQFAEYGTRTNVATRCDPSFGFLTLEETFAAAL